MRTDDEKIDAVAAEILERCRPAFEALASDGHENDITGAELEPGDPERCQGNGEHPGFECCCDECDHYLSCFPEYQKEVDEALEDLRGRKDK